MELTEFLLARIAEDETVARRASPSPWTYGDVDSVAGGTLYDATRTIASLDYEQPRDHDGRIVRHLLSDEADRNGDHIARHDPARVLAECEAKRRIVEHCAGQASRCPEDDWPSEGGMELAPLADNARHLLRLLALPYADHPDYREEWKP